MLTWIRDGVRYPLDGTDDIWFVGQEGWGMAPLHRLVERGPQQHGDTDRGFRLDPRVANIVLKVLGDDHGDLYTKRNALIEMFGPGETGGSLEWAVGSVVRRIDCHYVGDMGFASGDREGFDQRVAVTLKAPDPTFYDPEAEAQTFNLGGGGSGFVVPMPVPHKVGASTIDAVSVVDYEGNWRAFPHLIRITGPITDCVITNETTGESLPFKTGVAIAAGDYYDIDCRFGEKTVEDSNGDNKIADLDEDNDLATWHLRPGTNSIRVTGTDVTQSTRVAINWLTRYLGI